MAPLKSSAAFHEQRRSLERARTEDYLKRKFRSRPEQSELIKMHILTETSAEPSLQAKQLKLKRVHLTDDLNDKIFHRPGPMELIPKNILPVHSSIKQAFIETQFTKASSYDEDSNDRVSPERSGSQSHLSLGPAPCPRETLAGSTIPSPTQVPPSSSLLPPPCGSFPSLKLTNGTAGSAQRMGATSQMKSKPNPDRSAQRHKKPMDNGPKIKKLKYHQYIPPDQKRDKEPPPHLDSSYAKILQQQQLFLQLQILSQQQQHHNYHPILPAPPKPHKNQLDEMKVAELKSELKLRSLPVYGTKTELIERLRTYQELNGGSDTTSSPTAGGTTGPGAEGAGKSSKIAAATTSTTSQQSFHCHQTSSLTSDASSGHIPSTATQQLMTCSGTVSLSPISLVLSDHSPATKSQKDTSFNSNPLGEMMSSPLTQLSLQSAAHLTTNIKEEPTCSTPVPCKFSLKPASLQKRCLISSSAHTTTTTAPVLTTDKDKMLQEKDKQIEELTMMLRQKQRLVEVLKMQLEHGKRRGQVKDPVVLVRVKQEPPDEPSIPLSYSCPPFSPPPSFTSCEMDVTKATVKQEATESEEVVSETTLQSPDNHGLPQFLTQEAQEQILLQIKPEQTSPQRNEEHHVCLQQTTLQLTQQQAIQKLMLQQQHNIGNYNQTLENQQKLSQQQKQKSHKQQLKQQKSQQQHDPPKQWQQQMPLKQQILVKQQTSPLRQQMKQQLTKQPQQIQIQINVKKQQVLIQKNPQVQQQSPQVSQTNLNKQAGSALSFPLDLLKSDSTPTLVTDSNGNHFLIALTSNITEKQRANAPEGRANNHISLQTDNGGLQVSIDQQQELTQCLSAPLNLKPFFKDREICPSGKNTLPPSSQTEICSNPDVLFSHLSPASIKMAASSSDNKDTEYEDDFIDMVLQTGEMPTTFEPEPGLSLDCLYPNSSASSPPPSPLQLLQSYSIQPSCDTTHPALIVKSELESLVDTTEEKQHLSNAGIGCLEDFLESTTGKPLLGVEPGGLLALIDDLHSQMLCTPSILDYPPSPMDSFSMADEVQQGLNINDWLDLSMRGETDEETPTQALLGPQTSCGMFSTDFLDSCMIR